MRKTLRIVSKTASMIVGVIFLIIAIFEFMILIRGETSLFEDTTAGTWLYLLRGFASLSCFLLALSLFLFPKTQKPLANLIATTGIALIATCSFLLMEMYLYIPLLVLAILSWVITSWEFVLSQKKKIDAAK